jgi:hypothetical protein
MIHLPGINPVFEIKRCVVSEHSEERHKHSSSTIAIPIEAHAFTRVMQDLP